MVNKQIEALKLALEAILVYASKAEHKRTHADNCQAEEAITAIREAMAEQPVQQQEPVRVPVTDNTYNYAKSLAEAIFKQHFASDEHYASGRIVWGVNDTVIGILTQIDNMVADMVRRPAQQQEPVSWDRFMSVEKELQDMTAEFMRVAKELAALKTQQQEPVAIKWTLDGDKTCGYNNWLGETPFGRILITWKGWKEYHDACVDEFPGDFNAYGSPDEVKKMCEAEFAKRSGYTSPQPAQQEPVAIEYWLQDTMESGRWVTTNNMAKATAEKMLSGEYGDVYPQGRIVEHSPPAIAAKLREKNNG